MLPQKISYFLLHCDFFHIAEWIHEIDQMKEIPEEFSDIPEISKAIELTQEASFSPAELAEYDGYWDQVRIEKTIKSDAKREGKAEGRAEGEQIGIAKGEQIGIAKGEQIGIDKVALKMLAKNKADDEILELTGLTRDALNELKSLL